MTEYFQKQLDKYLESNSKPTLFVYLLNTEPGTVEMKFLTNEQLNDLISDNYEFIEYDETGLIPLFKLIEN